MNAREETIICTEYDEELEAMDCADLDDADRVEPVEQEEGK